MSDKTYASYSDLSNTPIEIINEAVKAAFVYCFDAVNLVFELHSSTSGMYPYWSVDVSPSCTVFMALKAPRGHGGNLTDALKDFTKSCEELRKTLPDDHERKES